jgi:N-acetylmuramoyl-L-alanine amidase
MKTKTEVKRIYIDPGHNIRPFDTGSPGIKQEDILTLDVAKKLEKYLRKNSNYEVLCPVFDSCLNVNDSLNKRVRSANEWKADLFVSIHFNAFNKKTRGTEVFIDRDASNSREDAQKVLNKLVALGFINRGVKAESFLVLRKTKMRAILIETCFCDNPEDMALFNSSKAAEAIAEALLGKDIPSDFEVVPHDTKVKLNIPEKTILKPSTDSSLTIPSELLKHLYKGEYIVDFLADEESHYLVEGDFGRGFVFSGHCKIEEID